jgi:predicted component of type VI protein secretion system
MALRLIIISENGAELGERASVLFDKGGGSIGRARISYRNGGYVVEDTSTNGLYLNDEEQPVGRLGPQPLRPGDILRLGAYRITVRDNDSSADASTIMPFSAPSTDDATGDVQRDIGVELNISDLLVNDADLSAARRAFDPWGNPVAESALLQFDSVQRAAKVAARPAAAVRPAPPSRSQQGAVGALEAFCRGAGLSSRRLPAEGQERLLQLAGLLLREALVGIKELARTQRELRQDSGLCATADDPERVALQNLPVEDLLVRLLLGHEQQQLDAVQWLRELFGLASRHDAALMRALRPALSEFTQRLDPAALSPGSPTPERFRSITDMPDGRLPHLFAESLARSFNDEIAMGPDDK